MMIERKQINALEIELTNRLIFDFWSNVTKSELDESWEWKGSSDGAFGYGLVYHNRNTRYKAHRVSYLIHNGMLPEDMCVCHKCDTPKCVNPNHLFLGSIADNNADMKAKGRNVIAGCFVELSKLSDGERKRYRPSSKFVPRGVNSVHSKLTESQVIDIFKRVHSGQSARSLAREYGVSGVAVDNIKHRKSWRHITEEVQI